MGTVIVLPLLVIIPLALLILRDLYREAYSN